MAESQLKLHEAMMEVLKECPQITATLEFVSSEIAKRGLYFQKDGGVAPRNQIRLRTKNYPHLFDVIPPNKVRLK